MPTRAELLEADPLLRDRWEAIEYWATAKVSFPRAVREIRRIAPTLLTRSVKTEKGTKIGVETGILYMSPFKEAGINMCPWASPACIETCLGHSSGQMVFDTSKRARILRTWLYRYHRTFFDYILHVELENLQKRAAKKDRRPYARLDGTSDQGIAEQFAIRFPEIQFYDYTKSRNRMARFLAGRLPKNWHLTFSLSENNHDIAAGILRRGGNVAAVFRGDIPPFLRYTMDLGFSRARTVSAEYYAEQTNVKARTLFRVVDGDETDARPDDSHGVIVGLTAKGKAKKDTTGFVL